MPLGPSILSDSKAAERNCAQLNSGVLVLPWWMRTYTTLVDCVAWQVLCSERLTTRMVETSMIKLFQVRACSDCKIPRLPHGHGWWVISASRRNHLARLEQPHLCLGTKLRELSSGHTAMAFSGSFPAVWGKQLNFCLDGASSEVGNTDGDAGLG